MAFSKKDALEAAANILNGPRVNEAARLNRIAAALSPKWNSLPDVVLPKDPTDAMRALAWKSRTNFLPLVVDTFSQVMKVDGYAATSSAENGKPWAYWQRNALDARQTGVHRSALAYGASYVTVLPGDAGPVLRGVSPRQMTALYQDPTEDEWPMLALRVDGDLLRLYDEDQVYYIGAENQPRSGLTNTEDWYSYIGGGGLQFIEARAHNLGVCPVVRFRDRMLLEGEEQFGIVEPIISIQQRIDETAFGMLVAQFYAAFKQRYVIGWVPKDEMEQMQASAAEFWTFADADVKVGQFNETDVQRYIASKESASQDMAAIAQVPAQNLGLGGVANISAETLAALEAGKDRKSDEITTSLGESWEQALRLAAHIGGDEDSATDFSSQVRWKDATARSLAQVVDAAGKMVQMLGVPQEAAWDLLPITDQDRERWRGLRKSEDPVSSLMDSLDRQQNANQG